MNSHSKDINARNPALKIVRNALGSVTGFLVKEGGPKILAAVLPHSTAVLAAGVASEIVKVVISQLMEATSVVERKIDIILDEPFQTSMRRLHDALRVKAESPKQIGARTQQLISAYNDLEKAYSYVKKQKPELCLTIVLYKAIVAALIEGYEEYMNLCLQDLGDLTQAARESAKKCEDEANEIKFEDYKSKMHQQREVHWTIMHDGLEREMSFWSMEADKSHNKTHLEREAETLNKYADHMDIFCEFVRNLAKNRDNVFIVTEGKKESE